MHRFFHNVVTTLRSSGKQLISEAIRVASSDGASSSAPRYPAASFISGLRDAASRCQFMPPGIHMQARSACTSLRFTTARQLYDQTNSSGSGSSITSYQPEQLTLITAAQCMPLHHAWHEHAAHCKLQPHHRSMQQPATAGSLAIGSATMHHVNSLKQDTGAALLSPQTPMQLQQQGRHGGTHLHGFVHGLLSSNSAHMLTLVPSFGNQLQQWRAAAQLSRVRVPKGAGFNDVIMPNTTQLVYGAYGIRAITGKRVAANTIEAVRRTLRRRLKKDAKLWIRIEADVPVTRKPEGIRMGKGKGAIAFYATPVRPGQILFEIDRVPRNIALQAMQSIQAKFPCKLGFVEWS